MKHISFKRYWIALVSIVACAVLVTACSTISEFPAFETVYLTPIATATFAITDSKTCSRIRNPGDLVTGAQPPPAFLGPGVAAVGYEGSYVNHDWQNVHYMSSAVRFDLSRIPPGAAPELVTATLRFYVVPGARNGLDGPCDPINRIERATVRWLPTTSDFTTEIMSERIPGVRITHTGNRFDCDVTRAVQDWLADPTAHPNNGFVIRGPLIRFDACTADIGAPGDWLECIDELTYVSLTVQYLPDSRR